MTTAILPPIGGGQRSMEPPASPVYSFLGTRLLFISSSNELHAWLHPHLHGWGLDVKACSNPSEIRPAHARNYQLAIFAGPRNTWDPRSENRVAEALECIIECHTDHGLLPRIVNQRLITVSSQSLPGIFQALQCAINPAGHTCKPKSPHTHPAIDRSDAKSLRLLDIPHTIRSAFLASLTSSLRVIGTSTECKDILLELHNLSGSLRFLHQVEMSAYCAHLEEGIGRDGLGAHALDLALLQSEMEKLKDLMLGMSPP